MRVTNLDENVMEDAFRLCCEDIGPEEIAEALKSGDDVKKQICVLKMHPPKNLDEAKALVSNLVGQDGVVREAVSVKLNEFICPPDTCEILLKEEFLEIYSKGVVDVNPNICRAVVEFLPCIPNQKRLFELVLETIFSLLKDIENRPNSNNHVITKKIFKLYWCLEALSVLDDNAMDVLTLSGIFDKVIELNNYTILEKVARIVTKSKFFREKFKNYVKILQEHENFYVRSYFGE